MGGWGNMGGGTQGSSIDTTNFTIPLWYPWQQSRIFFHIQIHRLHWCCCINIELKTDVDPYCSSRLASIIDPQLGGMKQEPTDIFLCRTVDSYHHVELVWNIQQNQYKRRPGLYQHSPTGVQLDLLWSTVPKLFHSPASLPTNIIRSLVTFCAGLVLKQCHVFLLANLMIYLHIDLFKDKQKQFSHLCDLLMQRGRAGPRPISHTNTNTNISTNTNTNQQELMQWFAEGVGWL